MRTVDKASVLKALDSACRYNVPLMWTAECLPWQLSSVGLLAQGLRLGSDWSKYSEETSVAKSCTILLLEYTLRLAACPVSFWNPLSMSNSGWHHPAYHLCGGNTFRDAGDHSGSSTVDLALSSFLEGCSGSASEACFPCVNRPRRRERQGYGRLGQPEQHGYRCWICTADENTAHWEADVEYRRCSTVRLVFADLALWIQVIFYLFYLK